jgi:hypothetical protein
VWVTPVQASASDISDKINEMAKEMSEDENILNLMKDPGLILLTEMAYIEDRDEQFTAEVKEVLNTITEKSAFKNFLAKYNVSLGSLIKLTSEKNTGEVPDVPDDVFYKIIKDGDRIKVTTEETADLDEDGIIASTADGTVYVFGIECGGLIQRLIDFLEWLFLNLYLGFCAVETIGLFLIYSAYFIYSIINDVYNDLGDLIMRIGFFFGLIIGPFILLLSSPFALLLTIVYILEWFVSVITKNVSKTIEKSLDIKRSLKEKIFRLFEKILTNVQQLVSNLHRVPIV